MALLELNPELKLLVLRLELENERLRPLRPGYMFFARSFRASSRVSPPCIDAVNRLQHFLLGRLPRDLQQQRLRS